MAQALIAGASGGLDVVALGPGDGQVEIALCKELCSASASPDVHLFLLDISHTLLTVAHRRARDELAPLGVQVESIHGDFHQLGRYPVLNRRSGSTRRSCYVLLGNTLANLDHEARFVRDVLASASSGDFMLLDFSLVYADAEDAEAVRRAEPVLNRTFGSWLVQSNVSAHTVAKLMGHTTEKMVNQVYGHLDDQALRRAVEQLPRG